MDKMGYYLVVTTVSGKDNAEKIAKTLVESKLAACVNIMDKITSIYSWKGEIVHDEELMLFIKTPKNLFALLKEAILQNHTYEVPEIMAFPLEDGHKPYLDWISGVTS